MEDVIRVREIRKSMEQSGHFFTPICSPMVDEPSSNGTGEGRLQFPSSTPRNFDLYMTLDCTPEEEPVRRKKSSGSGQTTPSNRVLRNRAHESIILDDTASSSVHSSSTAESSSLIASPDKTQPKIVFKRKRSIFFCF